MDTYTLYVNPALSFKNDSPEEDICASSRWAKEHGSSNNISLKSDVMIEPGVKGSNPVKPSYVQGFGSHNEFCIAFEC